MKLPYFLECIGGHFISAVHFIKILLSGCFQIENQLDGQEEESRPI